MSRKPREHSWSLSRARMFEECPRRFYYAYYYSQAGYAPDAPEEARLALEMKNIKGLDMWVGEIVHQVIQLVLERKHVGEITSSEEAQNETRRLLSEGWKASRMQLWRKYPEDRCPNLFEHYYKIEVNKVVTDRLKEKAFLSIKNFMESELFQSIAKTPPEFWLPVEKFATFRVGDIKMFVKFDFAMKDGKQCTIYDWKTGKPTDNETRQLTCYSMYTSAKWNIPIENIKGCAVYLQPELNIRDFLAGVGEIEDTKEHIQRTFNAMLKSLRNPERNIAAMDDFPMTGNLARCPRCNFKGICGQGRSYEREDYQENEDWVE